MRTRRFCIHLSFCHFSVTFTSIVLMRYLLLTLDDKLHQTVNFNTFVWLLSYLQFFLLCVFFLCWVDQQINQLFIIQLQETGSHQIFLGICCFGDSLKDVMNGPRNNTSVVVILIIICTLHSESFPCSCLSICKDSSIVPLKHAFQDRQGSLFKN